MQLHDAAPRSKNAKAFLNKLLEFHKKSQDGELVEELSILGFLSFYCS